MKEKRTQIIRTRNNYYTFMKISNSHIKNFRCLHDLPIPFENLTALVGRNGSGKSSVLKAIDIFYDVSYSVLLEDYCNRGTANPIEIIVTFRDFTPLEEELFGDFISDESLTVTKRMTWQDGNPTIGYYASKNQIPEFAQIRNLPQPRARMTAIRELINSNQFADLTGTFRSEAEGLAILSNYEQEHPALTELIESRVQFMGARNVGGGSLDNYTRFVMLPAVKEVTDELEGRSSPIGKLINAIVSTEIENRDDLREFKDRINREIAEMYTPDNLGGLNEIAESVSEVLNLYAPNSALKINWGESQPVQIDLPSVLYSLVEDNFEGDVANKGHGLQRALILTLLDYMSKQEVDGVEGARIDIILALEEPEIYLHPARCRYLSNLFKVLSERGRDDPNQNRIQVIYSTHSPHFVGLDKFDSIRILRKTSRPVDDVPVTSVSHYSLEDAAAEYVRVIDRPVGFVTRESFRVRTIPIMRPLTNEGFFSDVIVLVEGQSDVGVLWKLQEILNKEWEKQAIALIPAGGKEQLVKAGVVFKGIGIPTYVIFDCDTHGMRGTNRILRLFGEPVGHPAVLVHPSWACHDPNLETTLEACVGVADYGRLWGLVCNEFDTDLDKLMKNQEGTSKFTELAYAEGKSFPELEAMVEAISDFFEANT